MDEVDGDQTGTSTGNGVVDKVDETLGSELITNGNMEADSNWADYGTVATDGNVQSSDQAYGGTYSRKFITGDGDDGIQSDTFTTVSGQVYKISFQIYSETDTDISIKVNQGNDAGTTFDATCGTIATGEWVNVVKYVRDANGGSSAWLAIFNPTGSVTQYIDNVSVKPVNGNVGRLI